MLLQNIRAKIGARLSGEGEEGFTLIELLVVMLILGILAAIAIPSFFNQKSKATDASAKEEAHSAQIAMETCATENNGEYTKCNELSNLTAIEATLGQNGSTVSVNKEGTKEHEYEVKVTSTTGDTFSIERTSAGKLYFRCTGNKGGCPPEGYWSGQKPPEAS